MRTLLTVVLASVALGSGAVELTPGKTEVVIEKNAPKVVKFAADEATNFLSRALGAAVPVVNAPTEGKSSVILGANAWSKAAGLDPSGKPRDTFLIRSEGSRVYVVGVDDPNANPLRSSPVGYERATLLGLYAFLEDSVGCRFYFPGELGEVVPRTDRIVVRDGTVASTPDFLIRKYYFGDGRWYGDLDEKATRRMKDLSWLRVRASTATIPCCHGTAYMKLVERYAKTHPEYFALRTDGTRCHNFTGTRSSRAGYLCFSSGVRDVIVDECVRRFGDGKPYVDIMPNDALAECHCEKCQAAYRKDLPCYMTEVIWDYTRYVANKLIEKGVPGVVTQMAYAQYRRIPDFDIPTNVYVMVAETGPWSMANPQKLNREYDEIRAWGRKIRNPVYLWTYPHKYGALNIPGIPDVSPKAWGEYYKGLAGDIIGTFAESETDKWIYHYLNYYVFSRVMWDAKTDVDAVLDEHYRLMFGRGAEPMKRFYELLERKWTKDVVGNIRDTKAGPVAVPPTEGELWTKVYGPDTVAACDALLKEAAAAVAPGSLEARRIAFFRTEYYDALVAGAKTYADKLAAIDALVWRVRDGRPIELVPFKVRKGREPEEFVKTRVTVRRTATDLVVEADGEDNRMDDVAATKRAKDDRDMWRDAGLEIILNPTADLKNYYHLIVNLEGSLSDSHGVLLGANRSEADYAWDSQAKTDVVRRADGWHLTVTIPLAVLGEMKDVFPAEFARNRVTKSGKGTCLYHASPYAFGFNSLPELGKLDLRP